MHHVVLPGTDLKTSRLGFGCSGLMARIDRRRSAELLHAALDSGITHFDTARLYGYGEAESVLGEVLAGRRSSVTVTSKIGIMPPQRSRFLMVARGIARGIASAHPAVRKALRERAESMVRKGVFDIPTITRSLETSLRELRTDYLDILLLHECSSTDLDRPELIEFLEDAKRRGKIRHYGLATSIETTEAVLRRSPGYTEVVQIASNAWTRNIDRLSVHSARAIITHSALGTDFPDLVKSFAADAALRRVWSARLDLDAGDRAELGRAFLAHAMHANSSGVVLFSSSSPANIRNNTRIGETEMAPDKVDALVQAIQAGLVFEPDAARDASLSTAGSR